MVAVSMLAPAGLPWYLTALMLAFTIAGLVIVAKDAGRKRIVAAIIALSLSGGAVATLSADDEFVIIDLCKKFEPWSYEWLFHRCWLYADEPPAPLTTSTEPISTTKKQPSKKK